MVNQGYLFPYLYLFHKLKRNYNWKSSMEISFSDERKKKSTYSITNHLFSRYILHCWRCRSVPVLKIKSWPWLSGVNWTLIKQRNIFRYNVNSGGKIEGDSCTVFRPSGAMFVLPSTVFATGAVCVLREGAKTGNGSRKELLYQGCQPETAD